MSCKDSGEGKKSSLAPDTRMNLYRFFGSKNLSAAKVAVYDYTHERFTPVHVGELTVQSHKDDRTSLLDRLQSFSTYILDQNESVTPEVLEERQKLLYSIDPQQITFIELTRPIPKALVPNLRAEGHARAISDLPDFENKGRAFLRQSGLWIVSGQFLSMPGFHDHTEVWKGTLDELGEVPWETKTASIVQQPKAEQNPLTTIEVGVIALPWQRAGDINESHKALASPFEPAVVLDRKKYPIVFEIGRLAQGGVDQTVELYKTAVTVMYEEVTQSMQSENIGDAYVFARAISPANQRRLRPLGFKPLEDHQFGDQGILVAPLGSLVEIFGVASNSLHVEKVKSLIPEGAYPAAWSYLTWGKASFQMQLDFLVPSFGFMQKEPVVITDLSTNRWNLLQEMGYRAGVPQEGLSNFMTGLSDSVTELYHPMRLHQLSDEVNPMSFRGNLENLNAIVITNLDGQLAEDSRYLPMALMGLEAYIRRVHIHFGVLKDVDAALKSLELNFVLQTRDPRIVESARRHRFKEVPLLPEYGTLIVEGAEDAVSFVIPREAVMALRNQHPEWIDAIETRGMDQGLWFFRHLAADPVKL